MPVVREIMEEAIDKNKYSLCFKRSSRSATPFLMNALTRPFQRLTFALF